MKYLKLFDTHSQYESYAGGSMLRPNVSHCVSENEVHYNPKTMADEYLTFVAKGSGRFTFTPKNNNVVSYSTDNGTTWTEGNSVEVNSGDKVLWKGEMTPQEGGIGRFSTTDTFFDVQGNVMSLLYGDNYKGQTDLTGKNYAFFDLFGGNTRVVNVKNLSLPATTLATYCYNHMFNGCTSLQTAPELPATTLVSWCYSYMFADCRSLTTAPELPATTLAQYCYYAMFDGCTSLTKAPELPVTTLASNCYEYMFEYCANLTTAPELPATTLAYACYREIFHGCRSLETAPELPATTLADSCYSSMFSDCTSLTKAPELPATTLTSSCYSSMFSGCTSLTTTPELPATTLTSSCYSSMFSGCTSLTTTPELPATTLTNSCYKNMFSNCTKLNYIKAMFTTTPSGSSPNYYTQNWVSGVASSGTFVKNAAARWNVSGINGIPTGWTVQTATA